MKRTVLYMTAVLTVVLLSTEVSLAWLVLLTLDIILIAWCHNNITLQELVRYSGYKQWYRMINS